MAKKSNKNHLIALAVLLIMFFALLIFSTTNANVSINYNFKEEIELTTLPEYNNRVNIGEVTINNNGFLPSKIKLKTYVLCFISEEKEDITYQLDIVGRTTSSENIFPPNYYSRFVEVSGNENLTLEIIPQIYPYNIRTLINENNFNNKTVEMHIFEVEEAEETYNYCNGKNKIDAFKRVNVNININENELTNNENLKY